MPAQCSNVHGNYKASEILQSSTSAVSISESRCGYPSDKRYNRTHGIPAASVSTSSRETSMPSPSVHHDSSPQAEEMNRLARVIFGFAASSSFELSVTGLYGDMSPSCTC